MRLPSTEERGLDVAGTGNTTSDWATSLVSTASLLSRTQRISVARSRESSVNNSYVKAYLRALENNVVGPTGVVLQSQVKDDKGVTDSLACEAIESAWNRWTGKNSADVRGLLSWRGIQAACIRSAARDGEFMLRKVYGSDAGPFGFSLQVLDPQRCPPNLEVFDKRPDGSYICNGIRFNKYGKPLAYLFTTVSEGEMSDHNFYGVNYISIPADEIIHGFLQELPNQNRGIPWTAAGLYNLRQLKGFEDAAVVNARIAASKTMAVQWKDGHGPSMDDEEQADYRLDLQPGDIPILPEGAEVADWNPQYPQGEFGQFSKTMLRGFFSGAGVMYNTASNDLEGVNYSSIRQGTLDERESYKVIQTWLIETLIQPVFDAWLPRAVLAGLVTVKGRPLKAERIDRYQSVAWQPRRWAWIDPSTEADASVTAMSSLLESPSKIIRDSGKDPSEVWRQFAADIKAMRDAGIPDEFIQSAILGKGLQATLQAKSQAAMAKAA